MCGIAEKSCCFDDKTACKNYLAAKRGWLFILQNAMKIQLRAAGKAHDIHYRDAIDLFTDRIQHYFPVEWQIIASSKLKQRSQAQQAETSALLQAGPGEVLVALDEGGKQMTSSELARFIEKQSIKSCRSLIFAIGGAYGFDKDSLRKQTHVWSLSRLTLPHQLVRLVLAEQIYRACTILRGEAYHHES